MRRRRGYGGRARFVNRAARLVLITLLSATLASHAAVAATRILVLGDSLSAGYGLPAAEDFPTQLGARLKADGYDVDVENGGVSGDTSAGGLARLDWALGGHPDLVLVELGANDALRGIDPKFTASNLAKIVARLQAAKIKVLLLGMKAPGNWGPSFQKRFDAIYPTIAAKYKVPLYPFFLDGVALDQKLNQADDLHPNAAGVKVIVARVAPVVERLLGKKPGEG
jgi:acyl-CoA thioesterase I